MSYNITFTDQTVDPVTKAPIIVPVGSVNTLSTSLSLTGKGAANHGEIQQENLIGILENFASGTAPQFPTIGQMWFDTSVEVMKVLISKGPDVWQSVSGVQVTVNPAPPPPNPSLGDTWFEITGSASGFLYVFTGLGRYPTTATTIGGWEQLFPVVETLGGRDEYDQIYALLEQIAGVAVQSFGSGAITRSIQNLTNFAELDFDLREKYKALLPEDGNVLYSAGSGVDVDRDFSTQAQNPNMFYFLDSGSPSDGNIGGAVFGTPSIGSPGTIMVYGATVVTPPSGVSHNFQVDGAYIMWDVPNALFPAQGPYFVVQRLDSGQWQFDDNLSWTNFTPNSQMYIIGVISTRINDNNDIYPIDKTATIWAHAIPVVGRKLEHLKVEPNSQDWDTLLAAAKYSLNRLELPSSFVKSIGSMPFVWDGRPVHPSLVGLDSSSDVRFPSAARRAGRKTGIVSQVQNFSETVNALNTGIENHFSLRGINGVTGTNAALAANVAVTVHAAPPAVGLSANVASGTGVMQFRFRFANMSNMNRFLGSGGTIEMAVTHVGGALAGDTNFRALLASAGNWRISADKIRFFDQSTASPGLTASRSPVGRGLWNAHDLTSPTDILATQYLVDGTTTLPSLSLEAIRTTSTGDQIDLVVRFVVGSALAGTTSISFSLIQDTETYLNPGPTNVYASPLPFTPSDVQTGITSGVAPPPPPPPPIPPAPTISVFPAAPGIAGASNGSMTVGTYTGTITTVVKNSGPGIAGNYTFFGGTIYYQGPLLLSQAGDPISLTVSNAGGSALGTGGVGTVSPIGFALATTNWTFPSGSPIATFSPRKKILETTTFDNLITGGSLASGAIPLGTTLQYNQGSNGDVIIQGTPTTPGVYNFTLSVNDAGVSASSPATSGTITITIT